MSKFVTPPVPSPRFDSSNCDAAGAKTFGLQIMKKQRSTLFAPHGTEIEMYCVGGAAQHTVVDRDGISIKVIKRWPDVVGKPVAA